MSQTSDRPAGLGADTVSPGGSEYLTLTLGDEEYAIDILKVQEIREYEAATRLAHAPEFLKGVINLRGTIVPLVDMRIKFNLGRADYTDSTVVIILTIADRVVGIVVDGVSDVVTLSGEQVRPPPEFAGPFETRYIKGIGMVDARMLILVDIEQLMLGSDMGIFETTH